MAAIPAHLPVLPLIKRDARLDAFARHFAIGTDLREEDLSTMSVARQIVCPRHWEGNAAHGRGAIVTRSGKELHAASHAACFTMMCPWSRALRLVLISLEAA